MRNAARVMNSVTCAEVQQWLRAAVHADRRSLPAPTLRTHIAGCATCQGALLLLITQALNLASTPTAIECQHCLDDLPALIEQEIEDPMQAIRTYPHVWWHTLTCPMCAETYEL